jgi:hypothetical protein
MTFQLDRRLPPQQSSPTRLLLVVCAGIGAALLAGIFAATMAATQTADGHGASKQRAKASTVVQEKRSETLEIDVE